MGGKIRVIVLALSGGEGDASVESRGGGREAVVDAPYDRKVKHAIKG